MGMLFGRENVNCEEFRHALDAVPVGTGQRNAEEWRAELPAVEAQHLETCESCRAALEEFTETRSVLSQLTLPEPGPWFTARVMAAIGAKEREEEATDGVWISVRRLAPRMVAVSALLLVLGGSWAVQQRNRDVAKLEAKGGDVVFDAASGPTLYDDSASIPAEGRR